MVLLLQLCLGTLLSLSLGVLSVVSLWSGTLGISFFSYFAILWGPCILRGKVDRGDVSDLPDFWGGEPEVFYLPLDLS
jgi:hypothetical protein